MNEAARMRLLCVPPAHLEAGMLVAVPVCSRAGAILVTTGSVLDAARIGNLQRRGVSCVTVSVPDPRDAAQRDTEIAAALARVDQIFRGEGSEARAALHQALRAYRERHG